MRNVLDCLLVAFSFVRLRGAFVGSCLGSLNVFVTNRLLVED